MTNIERFESLMEKVSRDGRDRLMNYIKKHTDFYTAPASTRYHLACEGGLLQHSLNVYDCLEAKRKSTIWAEYMKKFTDESLIIVALLHDLCKANYYVAGTKNQKTYDPEKVKAADSYQVKHDAAGDFIWEQVPTYEIDDKMPLGHGEKSAILLTGFMKLSADELFAIRWHMGFSEDKSQYKPMGEAMEKHPIVLALHEADLEASKLLESATDSKDVYKWNQ